MADLPCLAAAVSRHEVSWLEDMGIPFMAYQHRDPFQPLYYVNRANEAGAYLQFMLDFYHCLPKVGPGAAEPLQGLVCSVWASVHPLPADSQKPEGLCGLCQEHPHRLLAVQRESCELQHVGTVFKPRKPWGSCLCSLTCSCPAGSWWSCRSICPCCCTAVVLPASQHRHPCSPAPQQAWLDKLHSF